MSTMNTVGRPTAPNAASDASYKPATLTGGGGGRRGGAPAPTPPPPAGGAAACCRTSR